jgi:hypothetical protein
MTVDYDPGLPEWQEHHWEKPAPAPCPGCDCCSERLCKQAARQRTDCQDVSVWEDRPVVASCPCSRNNGYDHAGWREGRDY